MSAATASLCLGLLLVLVGTVLLLVSSFRRSVTWGLVVLLLAPFGSVIYTCAHWAEAKSGFLTSLFGALLCVGTLYKAPPAFIGSVPIWHRTAIERLVSGKKPATRAELSEQLAQERKRLDDMYVSFEKSEREVTAHYLALEKRRAALPPGNRVEILKFNHEAAAYQRENQAHKAIQEAILQVEAKIDELLGARSRAKTDTTLGVGKQVVIYTTATDPTCRAAKDYLDKREIPYREIEIDSSPEGAEAFTKLGGRAVPLIFVGEKRLEGFSAQAFEVLMF